MALLGMGANIRCDGYVLGYQSKRDLIFGAEGNTWTSFNGNGELKNDCYQIGSVPLSSTCHLLEYNKENLKQTILKHEAIFRDQIHELHRIYQKQRELMDEIRRNKLYKHNLRLETSWSSSSLFATPNLPWWTGQSSALIAEPESIQLPLACVQEKSKPSYPPPAPPPTAIKESLKDHKLSDSTYRKVGKKILDLQLPADEYIDSEGESLEIERVIKVPPLSAFTLNGICQVVCNTDEKPCGAKSNGFDDLNVPFKFVEENGVKSDDDLGALIQQGNYTCHDMFRRMKLGSHNLPNDVIHNLNKKQDLEACSDDSLPNQGKKHGQLSLTISAGQNDGVLDSLAKFNDTESQSVSVESSSQKTKQFNNIPCFRSLHQITTRPSIVSSGGTGDCTSGGELGSSSASCAPYQLVSDMTNSGISPAVVRKSIKSGPNLDCQNYLLRSSFCSDDLNRCDNNGSSSTNHELRKYVKGSEYVGTHKNINLNILPAGCPDTRAFQSIQITGEEYKSQDSRLPWLKEKPVPGGKPIDESKASTQIESFPLNPCKSRVIYPDLKLNKIENSDLSRDKTIAFDLNGEPHTSKLCQNLSKSHWIGEIEKIAYANSPSNHVPDMGEQIPTREHFIWNEKKKHEHLAGIVDLNSGTNGHENTPVDIDLQAPASPENKECSPPRGESDRNQLDMPFQLLGQEDPEAQEEQARIAAEALVSISGFATHNGLKTICTPSESFVSSPLHWFSGIVSTIVDHSENEVKVDFNGTIKDLEDFLPADFDYFEFMSLNLTETKDLDCCCKSSGQNAQEGGYTSPTQPRKCRTNRGRRGKDFQSDILPSLASLSRYEVTEDLQTIGALVEASGTHSTTDYQRSAGRHVLARGKRKSFISASSITDLLLNMKQLNSNTEIAIEKRGLISWGKICRKRRGQRFPTSNPQSILNPSL